MTYDTVIGIDPSLTSAGIAILTCAGGIVSGRTLKISPPKNLAGHERLDYQKRDIVHQVRYADGGDRRTLIIIERAIPQRQAFALENLGLWWLITHTLWANGYRYAEVYATTAKKYITGNGGAGKDEMLVAVMNRYRELAEVSGNDTADALAFGVMAADRLGWPVPQVPKLQRASLDKCTWPEGV